MNRRQKENERSLLDSCLCDCPDVTNIKVANLLSAMKFMVGLACFRNKSLNECPDGPR